MKKWRTYHFENIDGTHEAMVYAENLKEACNLVGTTTYQARTYGWGYAEYYDRRVAHETPRRVFIRKIADGLRESSPGGKAALWKKRRRGR